MNTEIITLEQALDRFVLICRPCRVFDKRQPRELMSRSTFRERYRASQRDGVPITELWAESRQREQAYGITFRPGEPAFTTDDDGCVCANMWRPFDRSGPVGDPTLFLDHVGYLFGAAAPRFLDWLAHTEQWPGERPDRGWLHVSDARSTGRTWLIRVLEAVWPGRVGVGRGRRSDKLLAVVGSMAARQEGVCRLLVFSEHARPVNSRFHVARLRAVPRSASYYGQLYAALRDVEFINGVAHLLGSRDLGSFQPGRGQRRP